MPAIVDDEPMGGGAPISIFKSGAIMTYLAEKTGRFCPTGPARKIRRRPVGQLATGQSGPQAGRAGPFPARARRWQQWRSFLRHSPLRQRGASHLRGDEPRLFNKRYLAAGEYTIADMICYPWASSWATRKIDIDEFPNVKRWLEEIGERPAVKKAMAMGPEFREDPASISAEEQARRRTLVADQRAQPIPAEWMPAQRGVAVRFARIGGSHGINGNGDFHADVRRRMADPVRPRRLLSPRRHVRMVGPDQHPHHGARAGEA